MDRPARGAHVRDDAVIDEREELLRRLRSAGYDGDLERASDEGRLPTLALELALGGIGRYTLTHVARESGLTTAFLRDLIRATGRPNPRPRERVLTDEDLALARILKQFLDAGLPRNDVLEVARVLGQGMSQTAEAVRRMAGDALLRRGDSEYALALRYAEAAEQLAPLMGIVLGYEFRAHLRQRIQGQLVSEAEREAGRLEGTREVAIGFADLVDYTRVGERLPAEDLGRIAGRFTQLAVESVRRPTQLVKMIGDAAMFASPDTSELVATVLALVERVNREGGDFPGVRVGLAHGPATTRGGDWFGTTVNVASRVTDLAKPGRILATQSVQERAPRFDWTKKRRRGLKGVDGRIRLFALDPQ